MKTATVTLTMEQIGLLSAVLRLSIPANNPLTGIANEVLEKLHEAGNTMTWEDYEHCMLRMKLRFNQPKN